MTWLFFVTIVLQSRLIEVQGYYHDHAAVYFPASIAGDTIDAFPDILGSAQNRMRIQIDSEVVRWLGFRVAYALTLFMQDSVLYGEDIFYTSVTRDQYRFDKLNTYLFPDHDNIQNIAVIQDLDRALLTIHFPCADVFFGRQAIAWGSGRVINPTDIFTRQTRYTLDIRERSGVDACRIRIPFGWMNELDAGFVTGSQARLGESAGYVRGRMRLFAADVTLMTSVFQGNVMFGCDALRSIGGAGVWLESAVVMNHMFDTSSTENRIRCTFGEDYYFSNDLYGFMEYHYNGYGKTDAGNYLSLLSDAAFREGAVFLYGRHYLVSGLQYQVHPLISTSLNMIMNIMDPSIYVTALVSYNIALNVDISLGLHAGVGEPPWISEQDTQPVISPGSEFGTYPSVFYTTVTVYF